MRSVIIATLSLSLLLGCGGKQRGGGAKTAATAQSNKSSQKTGSAAAAKQSSAMNQGASKDGVGCDASLEGVGFCATEGSIVFCAGGTWWLLDCTDIDDKAFCGQLGSTIDCFIE